MREPLTGFRDHRPRSRTNCPKPTLRGLIERLEIEIERLCDICLLWPPTVLCYNASHHKYREEHMEYPVVIEKDPEAGGYVAYCPTLKGCVSQGETEQEALENIKDAIKTYIESIEDLKRLNKLRTVEVSV